MHQQPAVFNQAFQPGSQNVMMPLQASSLQVGHQWVNPNPALSMETVTINQPGAVRNMPRPSRQQQSTSSGLPYHQASGCDNNTLPQLSMRDLQCLDTAPQALTMSQPDAQTLFHLQQVRDELPSDTRAQNHLGNQAAGVQHVWSNFSTLGTPQNPYNGSVQGDGLGSYSFLEGMDGDDFIKSFAGGGAQPGFQLKQEPQMTAAPDAHLMPSPRASQGSTYTNLVPRPMIGGSNMDPMRHDCGGNSQPLKNLQNPFSNNGVTEVHFKSVTDWLNAPQQSD